jgi:hypothetical protein
MRKKTNFGVKQLKTKTPEWAKWMFRGTLIITSVAVFVLASDPGMTDDFKIRAAVYLKALDLLVFGFSKMFGVEVKA